MAHLIRVCRWCHMSIDWKAPISVSGVRSRHCRLYLPGKAFRIRHPGSTSPCRLRVFAVAAHKHLQWFLGREIPVRKFAFLVPGILVDFPWLMPALATALSLVLFFDIVRTLFDVRTASVALILAGISPSTVILGATFLSQPTSRLFIAMFLWALLRIPPHWVRCVWGDGRTGARLCLQHPAAGGCRFRRGRLDPGIDAIGEGS